MILSAIFVVLGLSLFETVSSVDNAIINAEVLHTMSAKARRWFLTWGMFIAVFLVRGILPFAIVWAFNTSLTPLHRTAYPGMTFQPGIFISVLSNSIWRCRTITLPSRRILHWSMPILTGPHCMNE